VSVTQEGGAGESLCRERVCCVIMRVCVSIIFPVNTGHLYFYFHSLRFPAAAWPHLGPAELFTRGAAGIACYPFPGLAVRRAQNPTEAEGDRPADSGRQVHQ